MRKLIPFIFGVSVLITPQFSAIGGEAKNQTFTANNEQINTQLLSRGAHYRAWELRGNEALEAGNYDRAIALYDRAIAVDTDQPSAWERRGDALVKKEEYQAAIEAYNEAMNLSIKTETQLETKIEATREKLGDQLSS